jgi:predicted ATPase
MIAEGEVSSQRRQRPAVAAFLEQARELGVVATHQPRAAHRTLDDVFDALVTYRNRVIGHGAHRPAAFYASVADRLLACAEEVVQEVDVGDLAPLVAEHDGRVGVLDHLTRKGAAYLDYASGETFSVPGHGALQILLGDRVRTAHGAVRDVPHKLPREVDVFVGRERDVADLADRVANHALVTLMGTPGTGKTRLAVHTAWSLLGAFPGGAFFADLAEARSRDGVLHAVASALDIQLGRDPEGQLGSAILGRGRVLLVFDNAEQVVEEVADLLGRWLDRAQQAAFLVTSRQVLGVSGEQIVSLDPLTAEQAVDLFVERVRQRKRSFALTDANAPAITELVSLLDGLPLAIELAAARAAVMPARKLLARMKDRWKVLSGAKGSRYATLRAAFDASWDALEDAEKAALAQVSVFRGGFTLEAAEEVLALPDDAWAMDVVQQLIDKSLLRAWSPEGPDRFAIEEPHFGMVMSLREYADEQLRTAGRFAGSGPDGAEGTEIRHGQHFAEHGADAALAALDARGGAPLRLALALELDNLVIACRRAIPRSDVRTAVATLRAAWATLQSRGPISLAVELAQQVAATTEPASALAARVDAVLARALESAGQVREAHAPLQRALATARDLGDRDFEAVLLTALATLHKLQGRMADARDTIARALALAVEVGDRHTEASLYGNLGTLHLEQGRTVEALDCYERALTILDEIGDRGTEGSVLGNLGTLHLRHGRFDEAEDCLERALAIHDEQGSRRFEGQVLGNLGTLQLGRGRREQARDCYERSLAIHREVGDRRFQGHVLGNLGSLHQGAGRPGQARDCYEQAVAIAAEVDDRHIAGWLWGQLAGLEAEAEHLELASAHLDEAERIARDLGDPGALAGFLSLRAQVCWASGDAPGAHAALAEAEAVVPEGRAYIQGAIDDARAFIEGR